MGFKDWWQGPQVVGPDGSSQAESGMSLLRRLAVIAILVPAFFLGWQFWSAPAMDPLTAPALLLDRALQLATLGWIPAAIIILAGPPTLAGYAAGYASSVGVALAFSVDLAALMRPPADWGVVAWATLALVLCAGVFIWLVKSDDVEVPKLSGETAKFSAAILGSGVAILGWWNQASFLPARTEAKLTQSVVADVQAAPRGTLRYTATNPTDSRVLVLNHEVVACWWKENQKVVWALPELRDRDNCRTFSPIGDRNWIAGNSTYNWQTTLNVPADSAQLVVLSRMSIARGDRLRVAGEHTGFQKPSGDCRIEGEYLIMDESRLKALAQEDKFIAYEEAVHSKNGFYLASDPVSGCHGADPDRLAQYYGVSSHQTLFQTWVGTGKPSAS